MPSYKETTPVLQSLTRPILILGAERENIILLACLSLSLCVAGRDTFSVMIAIVIWFMGVAVSKMMAKADPWATKIFLKSLSYQDFYNAREKINTPACILKRCRKI